MTTKFCQWMVIVGLGAALTACSSSKTTENPVTPEKAPTADAGTDAVPPTASTEPNTPSPPAGSTTVQASTETKPDQSGQPASPEAKHGDQPTNGVAPEIAAVPNAQAATGGQTVAEAQPQAQQTTQAAQTAQTEQVSGAGATGTYTVQSGDTLMKIAFENYGDIFKWRSIYEINKDKVKDPNHVPPGTVLTLDSGITPVTVSRNGEKYLIKTGDTLGSISDDVYGAKTKWRRLWDNNKELIHDPNQIFAGFWLYYTFTDQDRVEYEQFKGQSKPMPLAKATGADQVPSRLPASVDATGTQPAPAK